VLSTNWPGNLEKSPHPLQNLVVFYTTACFSCKTVKNDGIGIPFITANGHGVSDLCGDGRCVILGLLGRSQESRQGANPQREVEH
jgi:hypothetical protein